MSNQQQSLVDEQAAPDSWEAWQPEAIETPWWCGQWGSAGAAAFIWFAGSPVVMGSLCSGPIFGPTPVSGIVGAIVAGAGMVGAFIAFASAAKKSTPWQPVREEVEQPAPVGVLVSVVRARTCARLPKPP